MNTKKYESEFVMVGKNLSKLWGVFFSRNPKRVIRHVKNTLRENRRNKVDHNDLFRRLVGTILVWRHSTHVMYGHNPIKIPNRVRIKLLQSIARSFNYLLADAKIEDIEMLAYLRSELPNREGFDNPLRQLLELKILEFAVVHTDKVLYCVPKIIFLKTIDQIENEWKRKNEGLFRLYRLRIPLSVFNFPSS